MTGHLDEELAAGLEPDVAHVLAKWAELHERFYTLHHWLVNGRSKQPVAVVLETDVHKTTTMMLVLKVLTVRSGSVRDLEYSRHRTVVKEAPTFAERHLTTFKHEAIPVPGEQWITFQRIAGEGLERTEVLTVLLRRMLGLTDEVEPPGATLVAVDPPTFADASRAVVSGVLRGLARTAYIPPDTRWTVAEFFRWHLTDQLEPGGRLHAWAQRYQGDEVVLPGESGPLPNPFALATGRYFDDSVTVTPFLGRSHGDLHSDNALVQVRPAIDARRFYLIDTALYESQGPLTRDPVHFILYIIARSMKTMRTPAQQGALIDLLLDPVGGPAQLVPGWLALLVQQVDAEAIGWVEPDGLASLWREQMYLSLAACAMLFLGRTSTPEQDKAWFLQLAARAAARFAALHPRNYAVGAARQRAEPTADDRTWIGWLCLDRAKMEKAAERLGRQDEARAFCEEARSGLDRKDAYQEFVRQIGGPDPELRWGGRGDEGQAEPEEYVCPLDLCARRERRQPGGPKPVCNLNRGGRLTLRSTLG
jgi:hypothetical protein